MAIFWVHWIKLAYSVSLFFLVKHRLKCCFLTPKLLEVGSFSFNFYFIKLIFYCYLDFGWPNLGLAFKQRKTVSTSHCSQPNTIEYEMAMEWRLLQEKSECWWKELYKVAILSQLKLLRLVFQREDTYVESWLFATTRKPKMQRFKIVFSAARRFGD